MEETEEHLEEVKAKIETQTHAVRSDVDDKIETVKASTKDTREHLHGKFSTVSPRIARLEKGIDTSREIVEEEVEKARGRPMKMRKPSCRLDCTCC